MCIPNRAVSPSCESGCVVLHMADMHGASVYFVYKDCFEAGDLFYILCLHDDGGAH